MGDISEESILAPGSECLSTWVEDEEVILDMESGVYYGVNEVGSHIWTVVQDGSTTTDAVVDEVTDEFDVSRAHCEDDVLEFLEDLAAEGLVDVRDAP